MKPTDLLTKKQLQKELGALRLKVMNERLRTNQDKDKERLDWLMKANVTLYAYTYYKRKAFAFSPNLQGYELKKESYKSPRAAIDAAIRAEKGGR